MADLRISELAALAGANLAAGDLLPIADVSASETKRITVTDLVGNATTLIADATIPSAKILFGGNTIPGSSLTDTSVTAAKLANDAVTAAKLADESSVDLVTTLPASGAFVGQIALDTDDSKIYCWNGSSWISIKAAGSINTALGSTSGVINVVVTTSGDQITIDTTLDNTTQAAQFLAGPTASAGTVGYRTIAGADLPTATTTTKGAVIVNGNGLTLSGDTITINNTVTAEASDYHIVQYNSKGLVTAGRLINSGDVPLATASTVGTVAPGSGLTVTGAGTLNHTNAIGSGTATKVTFDSEGHITASQALLDTDIPSLPATKITSGTLDIARIGTNAVTGPKLANFSVSKIGQTQPTADYTGQFFFNPLSRDLFLWDGNVYQPIGISAGEIVFAGTYNATTNLLTSVTAEGTAAGFTNASPLPSAAAVNNRYYVVVATGGTGTAPAPTVALQPPDIILSNGSSYVLIDVSETVTSQVASNVVFTPTGNIVAVNVQSAIAEVDTEKVAKAGDTMTGALGITAGSAGSPSLFISGDTNTGVYSPGADQVAISTGGTGRLFIDASGRVGIGVSSLTDDLEIRDATAAIRLTDSDTNETTRIVQDFSTTQIINSGTGDIRFSNAGSERARIDSSGRLLVGTSTSIANVGGTAGIVQVHGTVGATQSINNWASSGSDPARLVLSKSIGGAVGTRGLVASGNTLGLIRFTGDDGTNFIEAAQISAAVDGTPGTNDMPSRLVFSTTADGASTPTERMRIGSTGAVAIGSTSTSGGASGCTLRFANPLTGAASAVSILGTPQVQSDVTTTSIVYQSIPSVVDAAFTLTNFQHFTASQGTIGASAVVTNQYGFTVNSNLTGATNNYGFYSNITSGTGRWNFYANGTAANYFAGNVGIGTTSPSTLLHVEGGDILLKDSTPIFNMQPTADTQSARIRYINTAGTDKALIKYDYVDDSLSYITGVTERARIDSSGRLLVGASSARATRLASTSITPIVQTLDSGNGGFLVYNNAASANPATIYTAKSRGNDYTSTVQNGDALLRLSAAGADGTQATEAARIEVAVDGTPGANDMPGRIVLSTTLDGASTPTERLRITNDGVIGYNQPAPAAVNATATLTVADLKTGIITSTSAAATDMTLPTGTLTEGGFAASSLYDNFTFEWSVINTGPSLVRVLAGTAHTIVGSGSVATGTSGRFASRRTAANTFVTYRLS